MLGPSVPVASCSSAVHSRSMRKRLRSLLTFRGCRGRSMRAGLLVRDDLEFKTCVCAAGFAGPPEGPCTYCPVGSYKDEGPGECSPCLEPTVAAVVIRQMQPEWLCLAELEIYASGNSTTNLAPSA
eukprot:1393951-Rhodomonas_salina.1